MLTVAIIGPDGAGKTTVTHELVRTLPLPTKYVYMGVNLENSNLVLPTTRLLLEIKRWRGGRPDMAGPGNPAGRKPLPRNPAKRALSLLRLSLRLANLAAEEWFRMAVVKYYQLRGNVVLFDRHFFIDYYAHDVQGGPSLPLPSRVHGWMLRRLYPRPELVICLDAPPEVLYARKGEGTLALLEDRRREYLSLREVLPRFYVVDATLPQADVIAQARDLIVQHVKQAGRTHSPAGPTPEAS